MGFLVGLLLASAAMGGVPMVRAEVLSGIYAPLLPDEPAGGISSPEVVFLGHFCFGSTATRSEVASVSIVTHYVSDDVDGSAASAAAVEGVAVPASIVAIVDTEWNKIYDDGVVTCDELRRTHSGALEPTRGGWGRVPEGRNEGKLTFWETQRPHFWYFVASGCAGSPAAGSGSGSGSTSGSKAGPPASDRAVGRLRWRLEFVNVGGWLRRQFSDDQVGMFEVSAVSFAMFAVLLGVLLKGLLGWKFTEGCVHPLVRLLTVACSFGALRHLLELVHWCVFIDDGVGLPSVRFAGSLVHVVSQLTLLALLIVIAKGWTISHTELRGRNGIVALTIALANAYWMLLIYWTFFHDPAATNFVYDSPPGLVLIALRVGTWFWFLSSVITSIRDEYDDAKTSFYTRFAVIFSMWFLYLPVITGVSTILDPWVREKITFGVEAAANWGAFASLVYLLWPTRSEMLFKIRSRDEYGILQTAWDKL